MVCVCVCVCVCVRVCVCETASIGLLPDTTFHTTHPPPLPSALHTRRQAAIAVLLDMLAVDPIDLEPPLPHYPDKSNPLSEAGPCVYEP